jgi:hypothetical protein
VRLQMSNEVLTAIVVINAIVTLSLWRMMATKASRPAGLNKKAAKALWHSDPIVPRHDPPKVVGGNFPSLVRDRDRTFFDDFKEFADVVNWMLADEYVPGRFRLQELPDGDVSLNVDFDSGPVYGRCFAVYYNQTRVGRLEIHPGYDYTAETPQVYTSIRIDWSRFLGYGAITGFLDVIASHVINPNPKSDEYRSARQGVQTTLTAMLWGKYHISEFDRVFANEEDMDWGDLEVSFHGVAEWYFTRRDRWQKNAAANKVGAATVGRKA